MSSFNKKNDNLFEIIKDLRNRVFRLEKRTKSSVLISNGTGTPEGNVTAKVGSIYLRTNGGTSTTLYVKETGTGNTGWVAK